MSEIKALRDMLRMRNWYVEPPGKKEITMRSNKPLLLYSGGQRDEYITVDLSRVLWMRKGGDHLLIYPERERVYRVSGEISDSYPPTCYPLTLGDFYNNLDEIAGLHDSTKEPHKPYRSNDFWQKMITEGATCG